MSFGKKILEKLLEEKDLSWYLDNDGKEQKLYAYSQLGTISVLLKSTMEFTIEPKKDKSLMFNIDLDEKIIQKLMDRHEKTLLNYQVNDDWRRTLRDELKKELIEKKSFEFSNKQFKDPTNGPFKINSNIVKEGSFKTSVVSHQVTENEIVKISYFFETKEDQRMFIDFMFTLKELEESSFINERYNCIKYIKNEGDFFNMVNSLTNEENSIKISNYFLDIELSNKTTKSNNLRKKI